MRSNSQAGNINGYELPYLSSHEQCIIVLILQLKSPYLVSSPPMWKGQCKSCWRQQRSVCPKAPSCEYLSAENPLPHHFVPGTRNIFIKSRLLLYRYSFMVYKTTRPTTGTVVTTKHPYLRSLLLHGAPNVILSFV